MSEEKKEQTRGEQLRKALLYDRKNGYDRLIDGEEEAVEAYCTGYKQFLDAGKTERGGPGGEGGLSALRAGYTAEARRQGVPG